MSTYYEYQNVGVMIAHKLMKIDGWKVYGYHADESDSMIDYYSPAYWNGVAEKNGYILCVNVGGAREPEEIRKYNYDGKLSDINITEKIQKLQQMTVERGASEAEAETARNMIVKLQAKQNVSNEKYIVVGVIPGHFANPPRCNWHIEKDGIIIAKGNGILKYSSIDSYYRYDSNMKQYKEFKKLGAAAWEKENAIYLLNHSHYYQTDEKAAEGAKHNREKLERDSVLIEDFEAFVNKLDTTCGGLIGEGDGTIYEKVIVTEYKKEIKAVETTNGSLRDGQCFILKSNFNYGRYKGLVYRIHEIGEDGKKYFTAYKLNGKLTKECHGLASQNNSWYIGTTDNITKWIEKGSISWCELQEVKTPYEVEKVVKKTLKSEKKSTQRATTETPEETSIDIENLTFEVLEDMDTRTNEKIYLVKVAEKLSREDYKMVNNYIKSFGGYYSKFKHAFLFREYPTELLKAKGVKTESTTNNNFEVEQAKPVKINYIVTEDTHTKTGEKLYLVKPDTEISKNDFSEIKRKFATIQGYYSSFKRAFIFKYDPTDKLNIA